MYISPIRYQINPNININHKAKDSHLESAIKRNLALQIAELEKKHIPEYDPNYAKFKQECINIFKNGIVSEDLIHKTYLALIDSNNKINPLAVKALLALAEGKSINLWTNLKNTFNGGCKSYAKYGLSHIADLIEACKDNDGNHNKKTLAFLGELEAQDLDSLSIPAYIGFCKDANGHISLRGGQNF